ncbi:MAG TPA: 23S rRNA (uracil(1939)-C(5))-methyltransferase RlmD [Candidatus Binatia bacterium]|nr:23S rRNA (uracil(1939)-C(5))-methyltransferase RlmD [Candidatus Binatia bacterium]
MLLTIEKLIYGGDALARFPSGDPREGKAIFVPFALAGEQVGAAITQEKPGFARARVEAIVTPSPRRVQPQCPYFTQCGGCHYQHADYNHQLEIKREILRENLRRIAKIEFQSEIEIHPSPPWNYRNRSRLQLRTQPEFAAGYFKMASHDLLPVEACPISSPLINRGIASLWELARKGLSYEGIREAEFFANADDTRLRIELFCDVAAHRKSIRAFAEEFCASLPEISGIVAFRGPQPVSPEPWLIVGSPELIYQTTHAAYRISPGGFFQTNRFLIDELINIVVKSSSGGLALDLYAGVGLFSTALAPHFRHIISVESSQTSTADLAHNLPANGKAVGAGVEQYLAGVERFSRTRTGETFPQLPGTPDLVVVDPPRAGLGDAVARNLAGLGASRLVYVSCDPATLARDLKNLQAAGYRAEEVHLVDLFPQTFHLETVVHLVR